MFRLYELYTLYLKKMSSYGTSPTWCLCEKLPRSILHISPPPELWCEVCGRRRRPRAYLSSSSDEEEKAAVRQRMLAERRRSEEARHSSVRVKVAMSAKKPKSRRKANCLKCGGERKPSVDEAAAEKPQQEQQQEKEQPMKTKSNNKNSNKNHKLYMGRFGHYRKPQRLQRKQDEGAAAEPKHAEIKPELTAPPPPPPSPPPSPPVSAAKACESLWEQPTEDMPNLVAFAHEVFNRPVHLRNHQPSFYDNLFVSDFIPLDKPITDTSGGAISKRRRLFGRPLRTHCSRPLPPLSQVLSEILAKQKVRAKGGGLPPKQEETIGSSLATQFSPFEVYDGPSEDALVVESARLMLRQPRALHIKQRADLPPTRLSSFESEPSSDCSSSSPFDVPSAPPAERPRHNYSVGAPLRLHEMMKAVAQSGLSDSSASSSSTSSSSHKSVSSTLPVLQQSVRSRGGEEPPYVEEKPPALVEPETVPMSIIEKLLWLMEQRPGAGPGSANPLTDDALHLQKSLIDKQEEEHIGSAHTESVKGLLQFMESLQISDPNDSDETRSEILKNDADQEFKLLEKSMATELLQPPNDMSNELPLNSTNKSAADEKYPSKVYSTDQNRARLERGGSAPPKAGQSPSNNRNSMWSLLGGLFAKNKKLRESSRLDEKKPLKTAGKVHYGAINTNETSKELPPRNQSCQKCGLNRKSKKKLMNEKSQVKAKSCQGMHKPSCRLHSAMDSCGSRTSSKTQMEPKSKPNQTQPNIIKDKQPEEDFSIEIADESAHGSSSKGEPVPFPTPSNSTVTGSTLYESCFGLETPTSQQPAPELRYQMLRELLDVLKEKSRQSQPKTFHVVKTMSTLQYASSEIIRPKMLASITPRTGRLKQYILSPAIGRCPPASGIYEFRTPDIRPRQKLNEDNTNIINLEALFTPVAHTASTTPTDDSSARSRVLERKKKFYQPVWPAHPFRHRTHRRSIKFEAVQLQIDESVDEVHLRSSKEFTSEEREMPKQQKKKHRDMWIVDEAVHQKIAEMMTKPIHLLTRNDKTEIITQ
ncbi:PREDICTED: uncharacterized protein LOC108611231 isoform X1 [Drosophila arizonae]|uniref:Uncharacterized protein LOC108611231 isoform X1 n=2 Tax=Drosophila arizonae TaxID=7263 RepID=A0ABM1NWA2_DROAR|nr:PREDICTED: uncharacterized protein LOC108611231 isoform X1 [Drosophila arizonae]